MASDPDRYEAWYAQKIWGLLPAIYRAEDSPDFDRKGPLRELVERIAAEAAVVRRSIDRLWEDQSIETCDDWVIPYLGDLLATNLLASPDARGRRLDVARTVYYRRRKGTVGLLEELATDVTGWSARVVEFFRRVGRTRHGLDPAVRSPVPSSDAGFRLQMAQGLIGDRTLTAAGGLADLRNAHGAALTNTAYDEFFHTADIRRGHGATGWHNITRLGVFVWRLKSLPVTQATPVQDVNCPNQYTFDPTGRDIPLFAAGGRGSGDSWVSPQVHELPGAITANLINTALSELYRAPGPEAPPSSLAVYHAFGSGYILIPPTDIAPDPRRMAGKPWIDAKRGRIVWPARPAGGPFQVDYHYGFSSEIGAGAYDRPLTHEPVPPLIHVGQGDPIQMVPDADGKIVGTLVVAGSLTYPQITDIGPIAKAELRAEDKQRPVIRTTPAVAEWTFTGEVGATLLLDGLFISGGTDLVLKGSFKRVTLTCCTLDPGTWNPDANTPGWLRAADDRELRASCLRVQGHVGELVIERCITGPITQRAPDGSIGRVESLTLRDSIVQAADPEITAIDLTDSEVALVRCTILGIAKVHRLDASETILDGVVKVDDRQHGCVRFSAWSPGSELPRQYESVKAPAGAPLFASREFGRPDYAQLLATASDRISEGAENGSEMGAFWREMNTVKERSLLIKYQEYLPLGLEPVVVHVT